MSRRTLISIGVVIVLLWASRFVVDARPAPSVSDPAVMKQAGDKHFEAREFAEAARRYRDAFALEDARDPKRTRFRSFLAFQVGRSYARYTTVPNELTLPQHRLAAQRGALRWLAETLALDPAEGWAHYEEAIVLDRCPFDIRQPERAREAYERFVGWAESTAFASGGKTKPADDLLADVKARIQELS